MNTPETVMCGLKCHANGNCSDCPYEDQPECSSKLATDAVEMLTRVAEDVEIGVCCETCLHYDTDRKDQPCATCKDAYAHGNWEWRGM